MYDLAIIWDWIAFSGPVAACHHRDGVDRCIVLFHRA